MTKSPLIKILVGLGIFAASFFIALFVIDTLGLVNSRSPISLSANGLDRLQLNPGETYDLAYSSTGVRACDMAYTNVDGPPGGFPVPPNTSASNKSGLRGTYTLTCTTLAGAKVLKSVSVSNISK